MESELEPEPLNSLQFPFLVLSSLLNSHFSTVLPAGESSLDTAVRQQQQDVTSNKASLSLCILLKDEISLVCTKTCREREMGPRTT